ncbi:MAG: DUF1697 domain-containing protein [Planctomycetota bacterium]|nr:MAG: DUF1697 domain-containing protein [Planctomycetota bacterium]
MSACVALYRGINVGGKNRVKTELLRAMRTAIQELAGAVSREVAFTALRSRAQSVP